MRNTKLDLLNAYIGVWKTSGKTASGDVISGRDIYEWVGGCYFLVHKVDVMFNARRVQSVEITHYDELDDVFRSQSFDSDGNISISSLQIEENSISILSDNQRFNGVFKGDIIAGVWEQFEDNDWKLWMNITLTRAF